MNIESRNCQSKPIFFKDVLWYFVFNSEYKTSVPFQSPRMFFSHQVFGLKCPLFGRLILKYWDWNHGCHWYELALQWCYHITSYDSIELFEIFTFWKNVHSCKLLNTMIMLSKLSCCMISLVWVYFLFYIYFQQPFQFLNEK